MKKSDDRTAFSVGEIMRRWGPDYSRGHPVPDHQRRVMRALSVCRTAALGGHLERCDACDFERPVYNSGRAGQSSNPTIACSALEASAIPLPRARAPTRWGTACHSIAQLSSCSTPPLGHSCHIACPPTADGGQRDGESWSTEVSSLRVLVTITDLKRTHGRCHPRERDMEAGLRAPYSGEVGVTPVAGDEVGDPGSASPPTQGLRGLLGVTSFSMVSTCRVRTSGAERADSVDMEYVDG